MVGLVDINILVVRLGAVCQCPRLKQASPMEVVAGAVLAVVPPDSLFVVNIKGVGFYPAPFLK